MKTLLSVLVLLTSVNVALSQNNWAVNKTADTNDGSCDSDCSLREAVDNASDGDTITFSSGARPVVTLSLGPIDFSNKNIDVDGISGLLRIEIEGDGNSAVILFSQNEVRLENLVISNGGDACLRIDQAEVVLDNVAVTECTNSSSAGGGVWMEGTASHPAELRVESTSSISENIASWHSFGENRGGGIYAGVNSKVVLAGILDSNSSESGGGIYLDESAELVLRDVQISNNEAIEYSNVGAELPQGGGIYSKDASISGNAAFLDNEAAKDGAAIYQVDGLIRLSTSSFARNIAFDDGGGLYIENGEVSITDSDFIENEATIGGAIYNLGALTLNSVDLNQNVGGILGAGIYQADDDATLEMSDGSIRNHASRAISVFRGKVDLTNMSFESNSGLSIYYTSEDTLKISSSSFVSNSDVGLQIGSGVSILDDVTFDENDSVAMKIQHNSNNSTPKVTVSNSSFRKNRYGGVVASYDGIVEIKNSDFETNGEDNVSTGGGIYSSISNLTVDGGTFKKHNHRSAIWIVAGIAKLDNLLLEENKGGAIYISNDDTAITEGYFNDLTINDNGGLGGGSAIRAFNNVHLEMCRVDLINNEVNGYGGALFVAGLTQLIYKDSQLSGNQASTGAAIYLTDSNVLFADLVMDNNTARSNAAAIFARDGSNLVVQKSTISNNVQSNTGAIVMKDDSKLTMINTTVSGNDLAGIYVADDAILEILNSTIANNTTAGGSGGGIYNDSSTSEVTLYSSLLASNSPFDLDGDFESDGNNAVENQNGFTGLVDGIKQDIVGLTSSPILVLADNGGTGMTHALSLSSAALDSGDCTNTGLSEDQRGLTRPNDLLAIPNANDGCDIGAFEKGGSVVAGVELSLTVLLAGAYDANGRMTTDLNTSGYIPDEQPYDNASYNYNGSEVLNFIPSNMVDWVLVQLRNGTDPSIVDDERAGLLLSDGSIVDTDGISPLLFPTASAGTTYVAICHRNHLCAMTAEDVFVNGLTSYDFTTSPSQYFGTNAAIETSDGYFALWGGDGDVTGDVTAFDFINVWLPENGGSPGYSYADFDMNGDISAFDFINVWLVSNGRSSQVP